MGEELLKILSVDPEKIEWIHDIDKETGDPFKLKELVIDEGSGLTVLYCVYPKGYIKPLHTHKFCQILYVLEGEMEADGKIYKKGQLVSYPEGVPGYHGATKDADLIFLSINSSDPKKYF